MRIFGMVWIFRELPRAPNMLQDRGFQGFWLYRKARRRNMLRHFEEEQRSETAESRRKPTGCNMFGALA
jgi:hypothetical protein